MALDFSPAQAASDANLTQDQLAARSQVPAAPNFNQVNSTNLNPTTPVQLPAPASTGNPNGVVDSATSTQKSLSDTIASLTPDPTQADQAQQSILDSIASLTGADTGKQQTELQNEQAQGVPDLQKQLSDLNGQLTTGSAEYQQLIAKQNVDLANAATTSRSAFDYTGSTGAINNAYEAQKASKAADLALVAAKAQAVSGNITTALTLAKNATDAKYAPIEDSIKVKQAQLAAIQPMLDKEQKTQALAQQVVLDQQKQAVQDQKDKENQINNIALNAAQAGADQKTLEAISSSSDVLSAINAAAPALGAKVANDLKQQAFDNALKLRTAQNDSIRVGIEQENANIALAKLQQDQNSAAQAALNAVTTTPSGKKYIDGTNLDAAAKAAALNAGQTVLSGPQAQAMTSISNVQGALGSLLSSLANNGVDFTKSITTSSGSTTNAGSTSGFLRTWAAGAATPAVDAFGTNLKNMITDLQKLPGTGQLVNTLQSNVLSGKDDAQAMQTKITNIAKALEDTTNSLLINNSQPAQIVLNGKTLTLQADGTYQ